MFGSPFNMAEDDHHLGNLKFIPKGKEDEVFGMKIPKELIMDNIRNASYYNAYLEMVAKHDRKNFAAEGGKKKSASKTDQSKKPATAKQIPVTEEASTGPSLQHEDDTFANIVNDTPSLTDAETGVETNKMNNEVDTEILNVSEEQGEDVANKVYLEEKTAKIDEGHAGSDPVPLLFTHVIDLTPPKLVPSTTQAPTFAATTKTTTTTTLPPPPPQQQSITDHVLASRIWALETVCANFKKRHKLQDKTVQVLSSRVFTSQPKHVSFYDAMEASMERDNRNAFLAEKDKSRKRRRDDQDPPPPPSKEPDQSKKKKHEFDAFCSIQTPAQTSSA
nr:histone deacetylase 14 [Tanacetum cinerariifolium]